MNSPAATLALIVGIAAFAPGSQAYAQPAHEGGDVVAAPAAVLATWPAGTFIESIAVAPDGTVHVVNHGAETIERVRDGIVEPFAKLPVESAGLLPLPDGGFLVTGRSEDGSGVILSVTAAGVPDTLTEVPEAGFLNGMTWLSPGVALAADSSAGTVWRIDATTGAVSAWLTHPWLGPADTALTFPEHTGFPAANGIKRHGDHVYVSNSGRALILRVAVAEDGTAGALETWAERIVGDDFVLDAAGSIYVPTHPMQSVVKIAPDGTRTTLATPAEGLAGPTAAAFAPDGRLLVVGNSAIPIDGVQRPATLLRLSVAEPEGLQQISPAAYFEVTAPTRPGSDAARTAHGQAYLGFLQDNIDRIAIGGQIKDETGVVVERVYLVIADSRAEALALMESSPYHREGVYGPLTARPFQSMLGKLAGGVAWPPR